MQRFSGAFYALADSFAMLGFGACSSTVYDPPPVYAPELSKAVEGAKAAANEVKLVRSHGGAIILVLGFVIAYRLFRRNLGNAVARDRPRPRAGTPQPVFD